MARALTIVFLIVVSATVPIGAGHDHPPIPDDPVPYPSAVRYSIRAEAVPDSHLIRGLADVVVENRSDTAIRGLYLESVEPVCYLYRPPGEELRSPLATAEQCYGSPPRCRIDSILYRGVPVESDRVGGAHGLQIQLEEPIPPGQVGFFIISFSTELKAANSSTDLSVLDNWLPKVMAWKEHERLDPSTPWAERAVPEQFDIDLWLQVDSSYDLAAPGELMNHRELYGLLPEAVEDSIYVDVVNRYQPERYGSTFEPAYESGRKAFYIRQHNTTGVPLIFGAGLKRDRTKVGATIVEHVYPGEHLRQVPGFVCGRAADLIHVYSEWLGPLAQKNVTIVSGLDPDVTIDPSLIVLPRRDLDDDAITGLLAVQLAQLWLPRIIADSATKSVAGHAEGIATYIAMRGLEQIYGPASGVMISKANDRLRYEHDEASFSESIRTIPVNLHMARFAMGDSLFLSVLSEYSSHFRHSYAPEHGLGEALRTELDPDDMALQRLLRFESVLFDYALTGVGSEGREVEYTIANHGDIRLPLEIAFVGTNGDTLYDTLAYQELPQSGEEVAHHQSLPFDLRAIMLDPHYLLLDKDRRGNVFLIGSSRDRSCPPRELFPAYLTTKRQRDH